MAAGGWLLPPIPRGAMAKKEQRQEESLAKIAEAAIEESRMSCQASKRCSTFS
jgi:hypothetical protein